MPFVTATGPSGDALGMPAPSTPTMPSPTAGPVAPEGARFRSLDAVRGVACLLVLGFHVAGAVLAAEHTGPAFAPLRFLEAWGFLGVDVFFVVSGYCIAAAAAASGGARPRATFLARRARRIFPTFWASMALAAVVGVGALALDRAGLAAPLFAPFEAGWHWVSSLLLAETALKTVGLDPRYAANPPLWSLCYEVQFYALVALGLVARSRRVAVGTVVATTLAAALVRAVPSLRPRGLLLDLWPEFLAGLWLHARVTGAHRPRSRAVLDAAFALALALHVGAFLAGGAGFASDARRALFAGGVAVALAALRPWDARLAAAAPARGLAWFGVRSYSLYLVHFPVAMTLLGVATRAGWTAGAGAWACALGASGAAVAAAAAFHRHVERRFLRAPPAASDRATT